MTQALAHDEVLHREREFHDALAAPLTAAALPPRAPDHLEAALLARAGDLRGRRVLELGCGTGDLTLHLLAGGAAVTALDLSARMVEIARRRAERYAPDAEARFVVAPVEATGLASGAFDLVVGKWILHHADFRRAADEIARVLRPGGAAVFIENSGLNPLLSFARRRLAGRFGIPRYGTDDEHPLVAQDYAYVRRRFGTLTLSYPDVCFFELFDRQVFRYRSRAVSWTMRALDHGVWRFLPGLRRYSYHVLLAVKKAPGRCPASVEEGGYATRRAGGIDGDGAGGPP
jgi:SAM-dependent methyltransferase